MDQTPKSSLLTSSLPSIDPDEDESTKQSLPPNFGDGRRSVEPMSPVSSQHAARIAGGAGVPDPYGTDMGSRRVSNASSVPSFTKLDEVEIDGSMDKKQIDELLKGTKDTIDQSVLNDEDKQKAKENVDKCSGFITYIKNHIKQIAGVSAIVTIGIIFSFIPGAQPIVAPLLLIVLVGLGVIFTLSDETAFLAPEKNVANTSPFQTQTKPTSPSKTAEDDDVGTNERTAPGSHAGSDNRSRITAEEGAKPLPTEPESLPTPPKSSNGFPQRAESDQINPGGREDPSRKEYIDKLSGYGAGDAGVEAGDPSSSTVPSVRTQETLADVEPVRAMAQKLRTRLDPSTVDSEDQNSLGERKGSDAMIQGARPCQKSAKETMQAVRDLLKQSTVAPNDGSASGRTQPQSDKAVPQQAVSSQLMHDDGARAAGFKSDKDKALVKVKSQIAQEKRRVLPAGDIDQLRGEINHLLKQFREGWSKPDHMFNQGGALVNPAGIEGGDHSPVIAPSVRTQGTWPEDVENVLTEAQKLLVRLDPSIVNSEDQNSLGERKGRVAMIQGARPLQEEIKKTMQAAGNLLKESATAPKEKGNVSNSGAVTADVGNDNGSESLQSDAGSPLSNDLKVEDTDQQKDASTELRSLTPFQKALRSEADDVLKKTAQVLAEIDLGYDESSGGRDNQRSKFEKFLKGELPVSPTSSTESGFGSLAEEDPSYQDMPGRRFDESGSRPEDSRAGDSGENGEPDPTTIRANSGAGNSSIMTAEDGSASGRTQTRSDKAITQQAVPGQARHDDDARAAGVKGDKDNVLRQVAQEGRRVPPADTDQLREEINDLLKQFHEGWSKPDHMFKQGGALVNPADIEEGDHSPVIALSVRTKGTWPEDVENVLTRSREVLVSLAPPVTDSWEDQGRPVADKDKGRRRTVRGTRKELALEEIDQTRQEIDKLLKKFRDAWEGRGYVRDPGDYGAITAGAGSGNGSESLTEAAGRLPSDDQVEDVDENHDIFMALRSSNPSQESLDFEAQDLLQKVGQLLEDMDHLQHDAFAGDTEYQEGNGEKFSEGDFPVSLIDSDYGSLPDKNSSYQEMLNEIVENLPISPIEKHIFKLGRIGSDGRYDDKKADGSDGGFTGQKEICRKIREILIKKYNGVQVVDIANHKQVWERIKEMKAGF